MTIKPPSSVHSMEAKGKLTDDELQKRILMLLKSKNLTAVQNEDFPFASLGTLARIRDGQFPKSHRIRTSFGLAGMVSVPSCPNCNSVHTRKCSPKKKKTKRTASTRDIATTVVYIKFLKRRILANAKNV